MYSNTLKSVLTIALLVCGLATAANAQDNISPEKRVLIKEIIVLNDFQKNMDAMMNFFMDSSEKEALKHITEQVNAEKDLAPKERERRVRELTEDTTRFNNRFKELMRQKLNLPQLMEQIIYSIYDKYFTEDDLKTMVAFYKSPAGIKLREVMPKMATDVMLKTQEVIGPKLDEIFKQIMEEEKKQSSK